MKHALGLPARTLLLILGWEAFVFGATLIPFVVTGRLGPPAWVLAALAVVAGLFGMHQAFDWDTPFAARTLDRWRQAPGGLRIVYGPAVLGGWAVENVFLGSFVLLAALLAAPLWLPMLLGHIWRRKRDLRALRGQGRLRRWNEVLPLVEQARGFLLVEIHDALEEAGSPWVNLSRLW